VAVISYVNRKSGDLEGESRIVLCCALQVGQLALSLSLRDIDDKRHVTFLSRKSLPAQFLS
jgi:hypothetical protein